MLEQHHPLLHLQKSGERLVGEPAKRQSITNPDKTVASIKRHMGTDFRVNIDDKKIFTSRNICYDITEIKKQMLRATLVKK